jgi:hypothetical protein
VTPEQARNVACNPIEVSRANLVLALDVLRRELDKTEALAAEADRQRILAAS